MPEEERPFQQKQGWTTRRSKCWPGGWRRRLKKAMDLGALLGVVEADQERQRRLLQNQALIAWGQAAVLCRHLAGEKQLPIYEVFPFWTTDEVNEMRLNEYRIR